MTIGFVGFVVGSYLLLNRQTEPIISTELSSVQSKSHPTNVESPAETTFKVTINRPSGAPRASTGQTDSSGNTVTVACSTCHTVRPPNPKNVSAADLNEFHGGLTFSHGTVSCLSCHNPDNYDTLKLADGRAIEYPDVMTLCAQCHGPQMRDYRNGAHGGMTGYWDLSRGPRARNNCVDCHDPHAPQFPQMKPTFKPRDRFLEAVDSKGSNGHE